MIKEKLEKILFFTCASLSIIILFIILPIFLNLPKIDHHFYTFKNIKSVEEKFFIKYLDSDEIKEIKVPAKITTNKPFEIFTDLKNMGDIKTKSIGTSIGYMDFDFYLGGILIDKFETPKGHIPYSGGAYTYHVLDIPDDIKDTSVNIKFFPKLKYPGKLTINPIYIGYKVDFLSTFLEEDGFAIILITILIVVFLISLSIFLSIYKSSKDFASLVKEKRILSVGVFCLMISIYYTFALLEVVRYLLADQKTMIYFFEYLSFSLVSAPVLTFVQGSLNPKFDKIISITLSLLFANFFIQSILTLLGILEYKDMLIVSQILQILSFAIVAVDFVFTDGNVYKDKKQLLISIVPIFINVVYGYIGYSVYGSLLLEYMLLFDVLFFIIVQTYFLTKSYISMQKNIIQSSLQEKLLKTDSLTGLGNRYSFDRHMEDIDKNPRDVTVMVADMNNLKYINDKLGHSYGDKAIIACGNFLKENLPNSVVYRTGGDEYFIISENSLDIEKVPIIESHCIYVEGMPDDIIVSLAIGYSKYEKDSNYDVYETLRIADTQMYISKHNSKLRRK